jgi:DNA-binding SARP family transcriptional activator
MPPSGAGSTRIQLCGRLKADVEGRHVTPALRGRQGRVLLAYLVLNRGRPVSRDELITAIWPDTAPVDPAAALRTQLSRLRSALGPGALAGRDAVELHLPPNTWIDVEAAERAIRAAESALQAGAWRDTWAHAHIALNISGRPFLAGFDAPWVEEVRRELEELQLRAREAVSRAGIGLGGSELAGAERSARALIRAAPFRESGYLNLMRALVAAGNTAEALRTYDQLRQLLAEELGSAPGAEVQALHRRLLDGSGEDPAAEQLGEPQREQPATPEAPLPLPSWLVPPERSAFVGRLEELGRLGDLWRESMQGTRRIVFLGGNPGMGKTRLATEFAARTHAAGAAVLYGRADEEATQRYQPFAEAFRHWAVNVPAEDLELELGAYSSALSALVPEISMKLSEPAPPTEEVGEGRLLEAVSGTLASISARRPVLLVLDDLNWADAGSLRMLRHIARSPHAGALMVLAAYRETEPSETLAETLADLGRERLFERIHLPGLSLEEVERLVAAIRDGRPDHRLAREIHAETDGNPFLVEALVEHLTAKGRLDEHDTGGSIYAAGVPALVKDAVSHRVRELGPPAEKVLEVASVMGRGFDAELLVAVSELPADEVIGVVDRAASADLLADVPGQVDRYTFSHSLFRETIYTTISRARRAALHRRLAEILEERHGRDPRHVAELARHYAGAGPGAAPKALEYGVRAGAGALGALAFDEAVEHYSRALAALDVSGSTDQSLRCELLLALGEAEDRAGDTESSRESFGRAVRIARDLPSPSSAARAALGFSGRPWERFANRDDEAATLLESALATDPDRTLSARLLARLAEVQRFGGRPREAEASSGEALALAREAGGPEALGAALEARWYARFGPDMLQERQALSAELHRVARGARDPDLSLQAEMLRAISAFELGDFAEFDIATAEHARLADRFKHATHRLHNRAFRAAGYLMRGAFDEVEDLASEVLELGARTGSTNAVQYSGLELFLLRWEQRRLREMEDPVRQMLARSGSAPAWRAVLPFLLAQLDRHEEARAGLAELAVGGFTALPRDGTWVGAMALAAMTAAASGDRELGAKVENLLAPYEDRLACGPGASAYLGPVSHHLGLLADLRGDLDAAVARLEAAAGRNERAGALPWLARSRAALAGALAARNRNGDAGRAETLLAEAGRTAEQLGMAGLAAGAQARSANPLS